jgi:hypothetical protein
VSKNSLWKWVFAFAAVLAGAPFAAQGQQFPSVKPSPLPPRAPLPSPERPPVPPSPAGPAISGTWSGPVIQVGSQSHYSIVLKLTGSGGESEYPELNCSGKLTKIGASRNYAFFIEVITQGQREQGGRCPDGSVTVARAGDSLAWEWFASVGGEVAIAYGTLTRNPGR